MARTILEGIGSSAFLLAAAGMLVLPVLVEELAGLTMAMRLALNPVAGGAGGVHRSARLAGM
jgi:hypothetical protein